MKKLLLILIAIVLIVAGIFYKKNNPTNLEELKKETQDRIQESKKERALIDIQDAKENSKKFAREAFIISQDFVKQELASPTSADFPFSDYQYSDVKNNTIVLKSYVDAENVFGAEIRHKYTIKMKKTGGDWADKNNWKVEYLTFE